MKKLVTLLLFRSRPVSSGKPPDLALMIAWSGVAVVLTLILIYLAS